MGLYKKILRSGRPLSSPSWTATLIISNDEIKDVIKIVKSFEDPSLLLKGVSKTIQNEVKQQEGEFLSMLLATLGRS